MTARLTYLGFHAVFVLPPLAVLGLVVYRRRDRIAARDWRVRAVGAAVLAAIALVYTTPWDNYLIARGVWWYGEGTVAATLWRAPVEEYLFFVLQPVVVALWLYALPAPAGSVATDGRAATNGETVTDGGATTADESARGGTPATTRRSATTVGVTVRDRLLGVAAGLAVGVVGVACLLAGDGTYYLGAILAWAAPVFALQWGFGWPYLWRVRRTLAAAVGVPTLYFWVADAAALGLGVWHISPAHTVGLAVAGLPLEEATFFLVTNLFVVQGLLLFLWVVARWR
ncbi:lycopene cyclase domain-containing protein [Halogeometricum sp. S1BR25-6]|uniref:Lycopene cyclase domain-containing protein n=1 Tax=Halogeometricum salsisoli TaxID=2950536 RepID=A0ABU2G9X2_9EURY|nr:lycopene cyclase domain-containing protein [Halogeometricum sp. S1BR25-6]MDS0297585.1 lycopene cyclase domain-containing protein [Halogeometricum sp. S1BR25-6]